MIFSRKYRIFSLEQELLPHYVNIDSKLDKFNEKLERISLKNTQLHSMIQGYKEERFIRFIKWIKAKYTMNFVDKLRTIGGFKVNTSVVEQDTSELQINTRQSSCLPQPDLVRYNVTDQNPDLGLETMSILEGAPVWMTTGERLLLYTLTYTLRPQHYLEIGTFQGGSALIVSSAMDVLNSSGRLYCVDPNPQISEEIWTKIEHRTTIFEGFSPQILQDEPELADNFFDMVLIDGDHSYDGAIRDAQGVLPLVCSQGYIIFHDSFNSPVKQAIDEFVENNSGKVVDLGLLTREITTDINENQWGGLRLIYVL